VVVTVILYNFRILLIFIFRLNIRNELDSIYNTDFRVYIYIYIYKKSGTQGILIPKQSSLFLFSLGFLSILTWYQEQVTRLSVLHDFFSPSQESFLVGSLFSVLS